MRCCGITVNPETGEGYSRLPVSAEMRALIRQVHSSPGRYEARYNPDGPTSQASERRSSAAPKRSNSAFHRPDELSRAKLRLRLSLLQRMRA